MRNLYVGTFDLATVVQLISVDFSDSAGEPRDNRCCNSGYKTCDKSPIEKTFNNLPERYVDYIVKSAIVLCAFGCLFAYIYIDWMNRQNSYNEKGEPDNYQNDESTRR